MIEAGTTLCDLTIPSSLDTMVERLSAPGYAGAKVELWVFDGLDRRLAAQHRLRRLEIDASIRCAYKPLVHAALEEIHFNGPETITIRYPVVAEVPDSRFALEAYPIADLAVGLDVRLEPAPPVDGAGLVAYEVDLVGRGGVTRTLRVHAPNRFVIDPAGQRVYNPSGWLRVRGTTDPALACDDAFDTDQEMAFRAVMDHLAEMARHGAQPFFDRLEMHIEAPFFDRRLPVGHESLSTAEAMHEDLYFSALDVFKTAKGLSLADRTLRPGQLVPVLRGSEGPLRVKLVTQEDPALEHDRSARARQLTDLAGAGHWLEPGTIRAHLDDLGGDAFAVRSQRGRPVWGTIIDGPGPGLVITAGQHANETTGPVGALRAAGRLAEEGRSRFCVAPLVNPDGYALFRELSRQHPAHMNHAARFTASGCDLHHVSRGFENEAHYIGRDRTGATLHMNLHGYPAHEWTRPFAGYIPRHGEAWALPRGFALILLYHPGWEEKGRAILNAVIDALSGNSDLVDLNRQQRDRSSLYAGDFPLEHRKDVPFIVEQAPKELFPLTIITEAPDETVDGDLFRLFHTAQMTAVLAAAGAARSALA